MSKKLACPFLICGSLSAFLGYCLYLILKFSFFDGRTQFTILACLLILFLLVWAAFVAESREIRSQLQAEAAEQEAACQQEAQALQEAAELLHTGQDSPQA